MFRSFRARIFWAILLVAAVAAGLSLWLTREWLEERQLDEARTGLLREARVAGELMLRGENDLAALTRVLDLPDLRLSLLDADGRVLAETGGVSPEGMDNHGDRPEVVQARSGGEGYSLRASGTLHRNFAYAARRLPDGRVLRLALPLDSVNLLIQKRLHVFAPMILLAVVLAAFISGAMRRSLGQMVDVVSAISRGRLQRRLRRLPGTEFAPLAEAVNRMADSIGEQVRIASDKTAQLESVLNTMSDGVLVLGPQGRIRRCNGAFARLFPQVTDMAGSPVIEVIPSPELQDAVDALLRSAQVARTASGSGDEDLDVPRSLRQVQLHLGGRAFSVLISLPVLADARLGAVLVFRDISDLMQLERIRSDFVANVSHELRTPLTAIQGYAETLLSMDSPEQARHFAAIIYRHSCSLARMLEDLLVLARLEGQGGALELCPTECAATLEEAGSLCQARLQERSLRLEGHLEELPPVLADDRLLTLVFRNLLENACRYAEEGTAIRVTGRVEGDDVVIRVVDDGATIPADDLPRIFERFYQVERHRGQNSTGLGLAICKHVIERHGGRIWAESPAEDGSTAIIFTLRRADAPRTPAQE
ncbi:ATP-binding protein [uncultured Desulfovibrio sp.]|uniref:ATP-binding protein n=1 Tax=uncultured Desulfovibrio sp. TaxID=167968 RepID=UPI00266FA9A8|nr:ATP-binding protein [uncultured Desulfovibrio sp.]